MYAGMDSGYQYLMIIGKDKNTNFRIHKTAQLIEKFQNHPTSKDNGEVKDPILDKIVAEEGTVWFLCKAIRWKIPDLERLAENDASKRILN